MNVISGMMSGGTRAIFKTIADNERLNCGRTDNFYNFTDKKLDVPGCGIMIDFLTYCAYKGKAPCEKYSMSRYENDNEDKLQPGSECGALGLSSKINLHLKECSQGQV
jgi:hypothetical protein